ncbi:serine hydrolase domain-containing protein [Arthrobacter alpinus]|uniref:serine hydrolase domain-containing protein n=1 Tax=Arthrobacter alpinus TaxID=656366 RepID=UPI0009EAD144|nr:serine hydrolase domain-containing protein [Arthrobacter alpinus]
MRSKFGQRLWMEKLVRRLLLAGVLVAIVAASLLSIPAVANSANRETDSSLDSFVRQQRADLGLPGLAVVVLSHGSVKFEGTYGDAYPGGPGITLKTPFLLGSTSKQFTALAVQQLISQRRLALSDPVGALLPELGGANSPFSTVTLAQLLSHTSGISERAGLEEFNPWPAVTSIREESRRVLQGTPTAVPGGHFDYSNANYTLLGAIIEHVTGKSFEDALQVLVLAPLGLTSTTSDLELARSNGLAAGYYNWFGIIHVVTPGATWPMGAPSAFITSTASDLTHLLQVHLGELAGIGTATLANARAPLTRVNEYSQYASGWFVRPFWELHDNDENSTDPSLPTLWEHSGSTERSVSYLTFAPSLGLGVVVLSNYSLGTDQDKFSRFTEALLHKIVGTRDSPAVVDPLVAAAPLIMIGLPILQLMMVAWLIFAAARPRHSRTGRWLPILVGTLITSATVFFALVVVPSRTHTPIFEPTWWNSTPDLAVSVGISLLAVMSWIALIAVCLTRKMINLTEQKRS